MAKFYLFITVLVLCSFENIYCRKRCEDIKDCMTIPLCAEAARLAPYRNTNGTIKKKFASSLCGVTTVDNRPAVQICCSDFEVEKAFLGQRSGHMANSQAESDDNDVTHHSNIGLLTQSCGKYLEDRIVGGEFAHIYELPWMALIAFREELSGGKMRIEFGCGGAIINSKYILTAAHCVEEKTIEGVRVGEYDIRTSNDCEGEYPDIICEDHVQDLSIEKHIVHKHYRLTPDLVHDIALLRVTGEIDFTFKNVAPICLPVFEKLIKFNLNGKMVTVAGWGITETGSRSQILKKVSVQVWSDNTPDDNKKIILAGNAGSDSCQGDSGGPLIFPNEYNGTTRMIQFGIVSAGPVLCGSSSPAKYTDVRKYIRWILDHIEE